MIERMQTAVPVRSSVRGLENATQGHPVNPMAPSYQFDDEDFRSQILQLASAESSQGQPSFILSQPGDQFSFKLPSISGLGNTGSTIQSTQMPSSVHVHTW